MSRLSSYHHPERVRRLIASLVPVVCPEGALRMDLTAALVDHVELSLRSFPSVVRRALLLGMRTYDLSAAAWPRARGRTASRLDPERAGVWFALWWRSPLLPQRELAVTLKRLLALAYYEMPQVQDQLDYRPQAWIDTVARRRLEVYQDDIEQHQASLIAPDPLPRSLSARRAGSAVSKAAGGAASTSREAG